MDRNKNRQILSRSLISIQVHVLKDINCSTQPELIIKNKENYSNISIIKINKSIYISAGINPNCPLIQPQDQTITELTTLCTNSQPIIVANGGIEVIFQCTPYLCEKYQICFVGEFGLKLPATNTECFLIQAIGTGRLFEGEMKNVFMLFKEDECTIAARNYDFLKPRNRKFVISEPINENFIEKISKTSSKTTTLGLFEMKTTILLSQSTTSLSMLTTSSLSQEPQSRRWLWILIALTFFLVLSSIVFFGIKGILSRFYQNSTNKNQFRSSKRGGSYAAIKSNRATIDLNKKQIETPVTPYDQYKNTPTTPTRKIRSQHIRLGPLDE